MHVSLPDPPPGKTGWPWSLGSIPPRDVCTGEHLPEITVVTPSFNQGDYLEETIRSVLMQGYPKLQYIVVDGGSTDKSHEVLAKYAHAISHLIQEPDEGQSDAICKGLQLATGTFFNWINSDDFLWPGVLWELAERFRPEMDLYTFSVSVEGEGVTTYRMHNERLSALHMLRADRYSFSQPGLWFNTDSLRACGGIDKSLNYGFDWDLLVRYLAAHPRVQYSKSIGATFRLHDTSKTVVESAKTDHKQNRFHHELDLIRNKLEQTLPKQLANASRLGRCREPWNQTLVNYLDDFESSPLKSTLEIVRLTLQEPRVRGTWRTAGAALRLMSRYVRPRLNHSS
jgi:glycosyltransferase involved in cell wall biosynthesis